MNVSPRSFRERQGVQAGIEAVRVYRLARLDAPPGELLVEFGEELPQSGRIVFHHPETGLLGNAVDIDELPLGKRVRRELGQTLIVLLLEDLAVPLGDIVGEKADIGRVAELVEGVDVVEADRRASGIDQEPAARSRGIVDSRRDERRHRHHHKWLPGGPGDRSPKEPVEPVGMAKVIGQPEVGSNGELHDLAFPETQREHGGQVPIGGQKTVGVRGGLDAGQDDRFAELVLAILVVETGYRMPVPRDPHR